MKNIFRTITLFVAAASFCACADILNEYPLDDLSPDSFFSSDEELMSFSNNFYSMISAPFAEEADLYVPASLSEEVRGARQVPNSGGGWTWTTLRNVNTMLGNLDHCKDEAVRTKYEALGRFFRAYFYFDKVKRFGDVPWYDKELGSADEDLYKPQDSRELVMQNVIADLDFAIANLTSTKSTVRVTKWTALALKSRACLYEGTFRKYHAGDPFTATLPADAKPYSWYLEQAAEAASEFIASSGYIIYNKGTFNTNYRYLFSTNNATDEEVILVRHYDAAYGATHTAGANYTTPTLGRQGMSFKYFASYLMKDGTRFTDKAGWESMLFVDAAKNRDPRLAQSIRTPGFKVDGEETFTAPEIKNSGTGFQPTKYVTTREQMKYNLTDIDLISFRAAEVYLNYAEAKAELGTLTQGDLDLSLNKLRDRVGMPHLNMADANANPDPFLTNTEWGGFRNVSGANKGVILEIRRERAVELGQEGFRYDDIMRWKEGKTFEAQFYGMYFPGAGNYDLDGDGTVDACLYSGDKPSVNAKDYFEIGKDVTLSGTSSGYLNPHKSIKCTWNEDKDYLYPVPIYDRQLTDGALKQNPGWNDNLTF